MTQIPKGISPLPYSSSDLIYFVLSFVVNRSRNQKIQRRNLAYEGIKLGEPRDAVVAAMGPPHTVRACEYTPFSDRKLEAEFRAKCVSAIRVCVLYEDLYRFIR